MSREELLLVYDKECPACNNYCQAIRIRESVGKLTIVNARDDSDIVREITRLGLDIDQGMVLKVGKQLYYGAEAVHALALISSRNGYFNRINHWIFKSKSISRILYPFLKLLRNMLLKIKGVKKINNLGKRNNEHF